MTAYSIFQGFSVLTGSEWNNLRIDQQISLVASLIDSGTNLLNGVSSSKGQNDVQSEAYSDQLKDAWDLWKTAASGGAGGASGIDGAIGSSVISNVPEPEEIELDEFGSSVDENVPEAVGEQAARQAVRPNPVEGKVAGFSYWEDDFSVADQVSGFIGFFAGCAATISLGLQVKQDFDNGQNPGVKALDILQIIDVGLGTIVGGIAFFSTFASVSFACVPIAGAVLAVAGFILMMVSIWVHPNPPESPAQQFLDGDGGSWMNNCPAHPDPVLQYSMSPSSAKAGAV